MTKEYVMKRLKLLTEHKGVQTFNYDEASIVLEEIERLSNIINELEKHLQNEMHNGRSEDNVWLMGCYDEDREILDKLQELKGSDKE